MDDGAPPELVNLLYAYAFRASRPGSLEGFRRMAGRRGRLGGVTAACFVLHRTADKRMASVHRFLFHTAPVLIQQLSRTTEPQRVVLHGRTRGRIDWSSTYKARYAEDANPSVYVCLQNWRRFNRPENQLFKFVLHHIRLCLERIPPALWRWRAWGPALRSPAGEPLEIGEYLATLKHHTRALSAHISLREVELPATIGGQHPLAARTSKNGLYVAVADLYDRYQAVVNAPDWEQWALTLEETLPLPPSADELGRLLVV